MCASPACGHATCSIFLKNSYVSEQTHPNFHGLRDYYSLIKHIGRKSSENAAVYFEEVLYDGLCRNFGGLPDEMDAIARSFYVSDRVPKKYDPVAQIKNNIGDRNARHLLVVTDGDAALAVLREHLKTVDVPLTEIFGSRFPADNTPDYGYATSRPPHPHDHLRHFEFVLLSSTPVKKAVARARTSPVASVLHKLEHRLRT